MKSLALFLLILPAGCGTIGTLAQNEQRFLAFSGIRFDVQEAGTVDAWDFYPWWIACMDLPFSLAADTVVLPYTLLRELWRNPD